MFLKQIALFSLTLAACIPTQAKELTVLEAGSYRLISGNPSLCSDFSISENETSEKIVTLGNSYSYNTTNSTNTVESEFDSNCRFIEQNKVQETANETRLTCIDDERCNDRLRSRTISIAVIQRDRIEIRHEINGAEPYTCVWIK